MKISTQNMVISIGAGLVAFVLSAQLIGGMVSLVILTPAVTAIFWAYFSKKEKEDRDRKDQQTPPQ